MPLDSGGVEQGKKMLTGVNSTMMSRARKKRGRVGEGRKNRLIYKAEDATWVAWGPAASSDAH